MYLSSRISGGASAARTQGFSQWRFRIADDLNGGQAMLRRLYHRLRAQARRDKVEREMDAEMRFHLEMEAAENVRRGMSEEEALRAALRSFGGVERTKEDYRDIARFRWIEDLWQDL